MFPDGGRETMKIASVLILCAALLLAACTTTAPATDTAPDAQVNANTPAAMETIPPRPEIEMLTGGQTVMGLSGAYCWLQATNDIRCEPDPLNLEPAQAVEVAPGDTLTFSLQGQSSIPGAFYAVLLDDADGAEPPRVEFGAVTSADYEVDLGPGVHRFDVVAEFPDISGDNSFVSYVFAVEVPEGVVEAPTEAPTEMATEEPTLMASPTEQPATVTPTEAVTEAETAVTPMEAATEAETAVAAKPTEGAEIEVSEEPTEVMASSTPEPSPTVPPTPTLAATEPPSPTPPPTATPQTVPEFGADIPSVVVVNGGQTYVASGAQICPPDAQGEADCISQPASPDSERIQVANGDTLRIDLAGDGPSSLSVALNNNSLTAEINRLELPGSAIVLYTIDAPAGNYVLVVTAVWPDTGVATYFFRLQIQA